MWWLRLLLGQHIILTYPHRMPFLHIMAHPVIMPLLHSTERNVTALACYTQDITTRLRTGESSGSSFFERQVF
jgi:hypothetical protein